MKSPTQIPIKSLLGRYYEALSEKGSCSPFLSEDFSLTGTVARETLGKGEYENNLFFKYIKSLEVKTMIIDGACACVVVGYTLESPKGDRFSCDVAEIWEMKDGKLDSLAMYFDTAAYQKFMIPILFPLARLKRLGRPQSDRSR